MKGLARNEQACVYFSGTLDPAARERLRRKTRCASLLRICLRTEPAAPPGVAALGPSIERYCTTLLDDPDQALEAVLSIPVPRCCSTAFARVDRSKAFYFVRLWMACKRFALE